MPHDLFMTSGGTSRQALGIPFVCWSTSEPSADFRSFQAANHGECIQHMHHTMQDQVCDCSCSLHPEASACVVDHSPSLAVYGTPCKPYSVLRSKRFVDGSRKHASYDVTFADSLEWLEKLTPLVAIMEQVMGFVSRESQSERESPMDRPGCVSRERD